MVTEMSSKVEIRCEQKVRRMQRVWTSNLPIIGMDVQRAVADDGREVRECRGKERRLGESRES